MGTRHTMEKVEKDTEQQQRDKYAKPIGTSFYFFKINFLQRC